MATSGLRWGRIALGGFLAELLLVVLVIPLQAGGASQAAITTLALAGSFAALVLVAWWLGRTLERPVLHGVLMGAAAAAIYLGLQVVAQVLSPEPPAVPLIYYLAHVLKLAGGASGGWLAGRSPPMASHV
jgi:hypothetical protein